MTAENIQEILVALQKLGYKVTEDGIELHTVAIDRIEVFIRKHERIGIYDTMRHTFVD